MSFPDIISIVNEHVGFFKNVCCEEFKITIHVHILYSCYTNENLVLIHSCARGFIITRARDYPSCLSQFYVIIVLCIAVEVPVT